MQKQENELLKKIQGGMSGLTLLNWNTEEGGLDLSHGLQIKLEGGDKQDMNEKKLSDTYFDPYDQRLSELRKTTPMYCAGCYKDMLPGKELWCGGCSQVAYCSTECQKKDWSGDYGIGHIQLCVKSVIKGAVGKNILRVFIDADVGSGLFTLDDFDAGVYVFVTRPVKENKEEVIARLHEAAKHNAKAREIVEGQDAPEPSAAQKLAPGLFTEKKFVLDKLGSSIHVNEITTFTPAFANQPAYLSYEIAMLNHSCSPNCYMLFDGFRFYVVSIRPIGKGEQLTIRYDDPFSTFREDMDQAAYTTRLWDRYGIRCQPGCLCTTAHFWEVYADALKIGQKFFKLRTRVDELKGETVSKEKKDTLLNVSQKQYRKANGLPLKDNNYAPPRFLVRVSELYLTILTELDGSPGEISRLKAIVQRARK